MNICIMAGGPTEFLPDLHLYKEQNGYLGRRRSWGFRFITTWDCTESCPW